MAKRYRAEPYLTEAEARVTRVDGEDVWLDDPILFAFSGGQQADRGTIAGLEVLESEALDGGTIRYRLPADHGLAEGAVVEQVVDRELRLRIMRVHTATHIAYSAMSEQMGEARETIGSNVHAGKGRLDWEFDATVTPWVPAATERVAEIVARASPRLRARIAGCGRSRARIWTRCTGACPAVVRTWAAPARWGG